MRDNMTRTAWRGLGLVALAVALYASRSVLHPAATANPWITLACLFVAPVLVGWAPLSRVREGTRRVVFGSSRSRFNITLGALGVASFSWLSFDLFQAVPRLDDSVAALFSARVFLTGHLTLPMPEHPEFFKLFGVLSAQDGVERLAGMYPPGWSMLLAPGQLLGVPWLVNPLLGGALAVTTAELGAELYDRAVGRLAGILVVLSPMLAVISATHLSHTSTALLCCLAWWAALRFTRGGQTRFAFIAGGSLGLALLCRPATALILGLIIGLSASSKPRRWLHRWRAAMVALAPLAACIGLLLFYQYATTGGALTPGHQLEMGDLGGLGFGNLSERIMHTPTKALEFTFDRLRTVDQDLLGWPVLSAFVVLLPFLLGRVGPREAWLLAPFLALLGFFAAFWYYPGNFPGRYLTAGLPPLLILTAAGWRQAFQVTEASRGWSRLPNTILVFSVAFAIFCGRPFYLSTFGPHHGDVEVLLPRVIEDHDIHDALVLVAARGRWRREWDPRNDYFATAFRLNDLDLHGDVVYARSLGERDSLILDSYPNRTHYQYVFDRRRQRARLYEIHRSGDGELTYERLQD